ncbi:DUF3597 domain-containing protein [Croceicoccus sp. F390]|uniref:DUF3597 domain-containing protein n=1 Tax=Croceicoccus esteveae TaxID=3075597 RepID=A0ABU2ZGR0_9SPHN|nr:DUF3597 domain-containing protein [Croceicoccus sp. F390]MDT0575566.1 DUF3597 domain-containing protein [Croceicoccus sp. F390]
MSIFGKIKDAIFGADDNDDTQTATRTATAPSTRSAVPPPAAQPRTTTFSRAPVKEVDVEERLGKRGEGQDLNWRSSIVDLMKLLGIDSSYDNRKELAEELGRSDYSGSAEDNIWLHKATMKELAKNGGRVPASMLD